MAALDPSHLGDNVRLVLSSRRDLHSHLQRRLITARIIANLLDRTEVFDWTKKPADIKTGGPGNVREKLEPEYSSNIKAAAGSQ